MAETSAVAGKEARLARIENQWFRRGEVDYQRWNHREATISKSYLWLSTLRFEEADFIFRRTKLIIKVVSRGILKLIEIESSFW